jgi:hypothetical protein
MKVGDLVKHKEFGWTGIVTDKTLVHNGQVWYRITLVHNGQVWYRIYALGISIQYTSSKWEVLKKV